MLVVVVLPCVPATATCQHLGSADHRDACLERGGDLGVGAAHGRGSDHHRRIAKVRHIVPDGDPDAAGSQPFDPGPFGHVRALHPVAKVVHHLGNARHADAADADEVDGADVGAHALHAASTSGLGLASRAAPGAAAMP
jgi:hypothetical protein